MFSCYSGAGHSGTHFDHRPNGIHPVRVEYQSAEEGRGIAPVTVYVRDGVKLPLPEVEHPRPKTV